MLKNVAEVERSVVDEEKRTLLLSFMTRAAAEKVFKEARQFGDKTLELQWHHVVPVAKAATTTEVVKEEKKEVVEEEGKKEEGKEEEEEGSTVTETAQEVTFFFLLTIKRIFI